MFAELLAFPWRDKRFVDYFLRETRIQVDWELSEAVWRAAVSAFQEHVGRRQRQRDAGPRRILADFLVGAHAMIGGHTLLTLDAGL